MFENMICEQLVYRVFIGFYHIPVDYFVNICACPMRGVGKHENLVSKTNKLIWVKSLQALCSGKLLILKLLGPVAQRMGSTNHWLRSRRMDTSAFLC